MKRLGIALVLSCLAGAADAQGFNSRQQRQSDDYERARRQEDERYRQQDREYDRRQQQRQDQQFRERADQLELERRAIRNDQLERNPNAPSARTPLYSPAVPPPNGCRALVPVYNQAGQHIGNTCIP